jgi:superfamily I DNA/RNA helicase
MQIIACAESGKTEVAAQRVADLLAEGVDARSVIAFTFTERAAEELTARIPARVEQRLVPPRSASLARLSSARFTPTASGSCSSTFRFTRRMTCSTSGG